MAKSLQSLRGQPQGDQTAVGLPTGNKAGLAVTPGPVSLLPHPGRVDERDDAQGWNTFPALPRCRHGLADQIRGKE